MLGLFGRNKKNYVERDPFCRFLPWSAYDADTSLYFTSDGCTGAIFEFMHTSPSSSEGPDPFMSILHAGLPDSTILQNIVCASSPSMVSAESIAKSQSAAIVIGRLLPFSRRHDEGYIPVRGTWHMLAVKFPPYVSPDEAVNQLSRICELLEPMGCLIYPIGPQELMSWLVPVLNGSVAAPEYDDSFPIFKQMLLDKTTSRTVNDNLIVGESAFSCITPKLLSRSIEEGVLASILTAILQYRSPDVSNFSLLYANTIILDNHILASENTLKALPVCWVRSEPGGSVDIEPIRNAFEDGGFLMQKESGILPALLLAALPLGLWSDPQHIDALRRFLTVTPGVARGLSPFPEIFGDSVPHLELSSTGCSAEKREGSYVY